MGGLATPARDGLRVVVVGATGNIGTSVVGALAAEPRVGSVLGLARRRPDDTGPQGGAPVRWGVVDIADDKAGAALLRHFDGADAVIHLAWLFQPSRDPLTTWRVNVVGSSHVFRAAADAGVPALLYSSSLAAYSPGPKDRMVDESWPTHGWPGSAYCRENAYVERLLDVLEREHPATRVVRMRPGLLGKRSSAAQQRRLFAGPFLPRRLPRRSPVVPHVPGLRFQVLHTDDAAAAFLAATVRPVRGAFNLAVDPVVDAALVADVIGARVVHVRRPLASAGVAAAWRMRLLPVAPGLFEAVLRMPIMDTSRARGELGWKPIRSAEETIAEFLEGVEDDAGARTAPLAHRVRGGRFGEAASGVGGSG